MIKESTYEELKRENEELRFQLSEKEQSKSFTKLLENNDAIILLVNPKTKRIVFANSSAIEFYGYSKNKLVGMDMTMINGLTDDEVRQKVKEALKQKHNHFTFKHKLAGGEIRDVSVHQSQLKLDNTLLFMIFVYDITDRIRAEKEIIESKNNFVNLQQIAKMGSWELDLNTSMIKISPEFNLILGNKAVETVFPVDEFLEKYIVKDDIPLMKKLIRVGVQNINSKDYHTYFEYRLLTISGTIKYMKFYAYLKTGGTVIGMSHDISKRKLVEIKLRKSEEKFRLLANHTHDWEYWIGADGQYVYLSPACERITGYKVEEFIKNPELLLNLVRPDFLHTVRNHFAEDEKENGVKYKLEFPIISKDGKEKWLEHHCHAVFDKNGNYVGRHGNNRDITKAKKAIAEINKLFTAVEQSANTITITNLDGSIEYVNPKFTQLTGYTTEDALGQNPRILNASTQPKEFYTKLWETITSGKVWTGEFHNKKKNGSLFWELATISPVKDANGNITNYIAVKEDITAKKKADQALLDSEERFRLLSNITVEGILVHEKGIAIDCNLSMARMFGYQRDELLGKNLIKLLIPDNFHKTVYQFVVEDHAKPYIVKGKRKNGSLFDVEIEARYVKIDKNEFIRVSAFRDVTQRVKAQELLEKSEARYRTISELTSDYSFAFKLKKDRSLVNEWVAGDMKKLTGFSQDEIASQGGWASIIYEGDKDLPIEQFKALLSNQMKTVEYRITTKKGDTRWIRDYARPVWSEEENRVVRIEGAIQDISKQKEAELAFLESEKKFSDIIKQSTEGITVADNDGNYVLVNPAFCQMSGYTEEELLKLTVFDMKAISQPHDSFASSRAMEGKPIRVKLRKKDGTEYWTEIIGKNIISENKELVLGTIRDITERIKAEEKLNELNKDLAAQNEELESLNEDLSDSIKRIKNINSELEKAKNLMDESQRRLTTFMNVIPDIVCYKDGEGRWLLANDADLELFDLKGVDYYGKTDAELANYTNEIYKESFLNCIVSDRITWDKRTTSQRLEIIPTADGLEKVYDVFKIPIFNEDGSRKGLAVIGRDITEMKKIQDNLTEAKEKAEESARLKSAFLANMSHEIRTPMNGILGFADLLKDSKLSTDQQKEYIGIIEKSGGRMLNIINNLINISMIESGSMETFTRICDVNQQIEDLYAFFQPEADRKNLKLSFVNSLSKPEAIIKTDREKLFSVLSNLIKNALKFSHEGEIEFGYTKKGQVLEFFVKDTGIGIPQDRQEVIFDRFIQADIEDQHVYEGAGLGLAISRAYVEMLNGEIWVESTEDEGSSFYFTIPYNSEFVVNETKDQEKKPLPRIRKNLKVLIAEDDKYADTFLSIVLKDISNKILHANTGSSTVDICKNNPDLDLILMDIKMPEMEGYEATRQIREFNKEVIIIAQTAYAMEGDRQKAIEAGCNNYISKPIDVDELMKTIDNLIKS